jgi:SNF2 family DNA or RNA helicase
MLVVPSKRALVLQLTNSQRITTVIPTARQFRFRGRDLVAVPHRLDEAKVLRNLGLNAPSPIKHYYDWPGQVKPFKAQLDTAEFLTLNNNAFVLNDMGTGKTLASLWAYDYLRQLGLLHRALIIAPLSTLEDTWANEIFQHFMHLHAVVLHGTKEKRYKLLFSKADIYIINHDGIKTHGLADILAKRPDIDLIIIDELSQVARNASAARWKTLNTIVNKQNISRRVWGMTGTPTPNSPLDAWAQCKLIVPGKVPQYVTRFRDMVMRQKGPFTWVPRDSATQIVHDVMQPAIRFSRDQCVDLPPCIYQTRNAALTSEQKVAYDQMASALHTAAAAGEIVAVNEAVKLGKLVQICCGVAYGEDGNEVAFPVTPRLQLLHELIEEANTKVIVFVPFVSAVNLVAQYLSAFYSVGIIHGSVSKPTRDNVFRSFQRSQDPRVIVAQPAAMSHGLTLTAANTIIWYSAITSNETYTQANARITRPGQKHTQFIINIEGSKVERRLYERLKTRQSMQGLLLDMAQGII